MFIVTILFSVSPCFFFQLVPVSTLALATSLNKNEVFFFQGSETYIFNCNRWLAKNEDDGAIVRELVADKVRDEIVHKDGTVKTREKERRDTLMGQSSVASHSSFDCNKFSPINFTNAARLQYFFTCVNTVIMWCFFSHVYVLSYLEKLTHLFVIHN